jgi:hypothetical protein
MGDLRFAAALRYREPTGKLQQNLPTEPKLHGETAQIALGESSGSP